MMTVAHASQQVTEAAPQVICHQPPIAYHCPLQLPMPCGPQVQAFIDLLTAASDFAIFVDMMSNRERREYFFYVMRSWRQE